MAGDEFVREELASLRSSGLLRRMRAVELAKIDFGSLSPGALFFPLDKKKEQDVEVLKVGN